MSQCLSALLDLSHYDIFVHAPDLVDHGWLTDSFYPPHCFPFPVPLKTRHVKSAISRALMYMSLRFEFVQL